MASRIRWDTDGAAPWWHTAPRDDLCAQLHTLSETLERLTVTLERFIQIQIEAQIDARRQARELLE